jgi:general secretion pathway protein L
MTPGFLARTAETLLAPARRAARWWWAELAGMLPARLRPGGGGADAVLLWLDDTGAPARLARAGGPERAVTDATMVAGGGNASVVLAPQAVLSRRLDLPAAAETALGSILRHQLDRLSPLPAAEAAFAFQVLGRRAGGQRVDVAVAIAAQADVAAARAAALRLGLVPRRVLAIDETGLRLELWRAGAGVAGPGRRRVRRALEGTTLAFLLAAAGVLFVRLDTAADRLRGDIAAVRAEAARAGAAGRAAAALEEALDSLARRRAEVPALAVLDELTRILPPPAWAQRLALRGDSGEIAGFAPRAAELLTVLQGARLIAEARFVAPITLAPAGQGESFVIAFRLRAAPDGAGARP